MSTAGLSASRTLAERYSVVVRSLTAAEWSAPSRCPGWSVKDLVAHTGSNFGALVDPPAADPSVPAPSTAEELQNRLVDARRDWSSTQVADEFLSNLEGAMGVLEAMQGDDLASTPMVLTDLGTYRSHQLSDAFAFDMWCHMYVDLLGPEGPVVREVPDAEHELVHTAVEWMWSGLPQMCTPVSTVLGSPLGVRLTGAGGGEWTLLPGSDLLTVEAGPTTADTVITSTATDFVMWGTTRSPWRQHVTVEGDSVYAERVLDTVDII
ncbi:maleylpyruvate isomerase family mycothiol-dependent enzyme [Rhodococcoides kyotonense]|uniref:TIGR03083 family protein n=1 Tax=Rhodococcoides kyotonense TaxID=398843 RepID=A0A239I511_9NOCA|nr:maleylpyruvate isomerase family mycothiol-dependent enzyme [Rhodococcus kyotonensis]SNS87414.1 TIGR03083 family protein [Rhodococcus kyotonensis]